MVSEFSSRPKKSPISKKRKVSKLTRSYTNVTCQWLYVWAFGDAFGIVHWQCHVF